MNPKLPPLTAARMVAIGGGTASSRSGRAGSHLVLRHADGRRVTVPVHSGRDLGRGLVQRIMRDAGLTADDLLRG